jgi:uncharacterized membrane protein HdeD (DUF308 family)
MTEEDLQASNRSYDTLAAIAIGIGVCVAGAIGYFALGIFTGVLGICSGASELWTAIYDRMLVLPPILGIIAGIAAWRRYVVARRNAASNPASSEPKR